MTPLRCKICISKAFRVVSQDQSGLPSICRPWTANNSRNHITRILTAIVTRVIIMIIITVLIVLIIVILQMKIVRMTIDSCSSQDSGLHKLGEER